MGTLRRGRRARISVHPRADQDEYAIESLRRANEAIDQRQVREGDRAGHRHHPQGRGHGRHRRAAGQGQSRQDPAAESRLRQGRHDHRRDLLVDQRRRRRAGADPRRASPTSSARRRSRASSPTPPTRRSRRSSPPRRCRAIQKVLDKAGWSVGDVDLFEVNEAFACVAMIAMRDIGIPHDKINVNGGATALGHPIGASGARITDDSDRRAPETAASSAASRACASAAARRRPWRWSWFERKIRRRNGLLVRRTLQ